MSSSTRSVPYAGLTIQMLDPELSANLIFKKKTAKDILSLEPRELFLWENDWESVKRACCEKMPSVGS